MNLLNPTIDDLIDAHLDITQPGLPVEMKIDSRGIIWVNVGPVCVLRICRNTDVTVNVNDEQMFEFSGNVLKPNSGAAALEKLSELEKSLSEALSRLDSEISNTMKTAELWKSRAEDAEMKVVSAKKETSYVNNISFRMTAALCSIPSVEMMGEELVSREAMMEAIVSWRKSWDDRSGGKIDR